MQIGIENLLVTMVLKFLIFKKLWRDTFSSLLTWESKQHILIWNCDNEGQLMEPKAAQWIRVNF